MFAFIEYPFVYLGWVCFFFIIRVSVEYLEPDRNKSKVLWPLPCHIICTLQGWRMGSQWFLIDNILVPERDGQMMYAFYYAYWTNVIIDFALQSTKNKDYHFLCIHHIATWCAMLMSDLIDRRIVGWNVLFLHDVSDIGISSLKISVKYQFPRNAVKIIYMLTMIVWIVTRLMMYGIVICVQAILVEWERVHKFTAIDSGCVITLWTLLTLNCLWTKMLIDIGLREDAEEIYEKNK